jgi:hypothetical protein
MGDKWVFGNAPDIVKPLIDMQWNDNPVSKLQMLSSIEATVVALTNPLCPCSLAAMGSRSRGHQGGAEQKGQKFHGQ